MKKGRKSGEKKYIRFDNFTLKKKKKTRKGQIFILANFLYPLLDRFN